MPPLALAYLGDAVFELCVRRHITMNNNLAVNDMNRLARKLVNAASQADMYRRVLEFLTEEEAAVIKRGRNARNKTVPKNADVSDYRHATGLEALFGYLYMAGKNDRINELFAICEGGNLYTGKGIERKKI
jgi:ribonuclease-3 family protein